MDVVLLVVATFHEIRCVLVCFSVDNKLWSSPGSCGVNYEVVPYLYYHLFSNVTSGSPDNSLVLSPYSSAVITDMDQYACCMFLYCARLKPERNGMMNRPSGSLMPQKET